jgi:DNA modification methylase
MKTNKKIYSKIQSIFVVIRNKQGKIIKKDITSNFLNQKFVTDYDSALFIQSALFLLSDYYIDEFESNGIDINIIINSDSNEFYKVRNSMAFLEIEKILNEYKGKTYTREKISNSREKINNSCVLEHIKTLPDKSVNTTFSDFPYFLGTEWHYVNGKLQMKGEGKDFMTKWSVNNADWWREYFAELYRVMKFGGYVCMYSIDRQAWAFQSLMIEAGFEVCQTLYWANISNFPKASCASKAIDRSLGAEREVIAINPLKAKNERKIQGNAFSTDVRADFTAPATELSKQFAAHKYGKAPFKKITEPLLIFRKAPKNGAVLNDLLAYQTDSEISPAVIDIENNRIGTENVQRTQNVKGIWNKGKHENTVICGSESGRFPCTVFNDKASAELLDSQLDKISFELNGKIYERKRRIEFQQIIWQHTQNGTLNSYKVLNVEREELISKFGHSKDNVVKHSNTYFEGIKTTAEQSNKYHGDSGFLSRVMHTADFDNNDYDSLVSALNAYSIGINQDTYYEPTVSPKERNLGCENLLYKGIEYFYTIKKSKKGKDTRSKFAFDDIQNLDIDSLGKSSKDNEKAFVKIFYDLVAECSETEITDINFVEIAIELKEYENENAGFYHLENGTFKVFAGAKELILQVENVIRKGNGHPTLKSIAINQHLLSLFRQPKEIKQTLYIPFSGAGSEIIGAIKAGYDIDNIIACEINPDYVEIAKARIEYYNNLQPEVIEQKELNNSQPKNTLF